MLVFERAPEDALDVSRRLAHLDWKTAKDFSLHFESKSS
jgi:hypothetical protein